MNINGELKELLKDQHNGPKVNGNGNGHKVFGPGEVEMMDDDHSNYSLETPLKSGAFEISDEEKMSRIAYHFKEIMETMGLDLNDDSLQGTPQRVAKMFVKEIFYGLDPKNKPLAKVFDNSYKYSEMLVEKNIKVQS